MQGSLFRAIGDLLFPPHKDVSDSRTITYEYIERVYTLAYHRDTHIYTALPYTHARVRSLVRANKFYGDRNAARMLAHILEMMLSDVYTDELFTIGAKTLLIPMPSSLQRRKERGYNQVERIVEMLPKNFFNTYHYEPNVLVRSHRKSQAHIPKHKRSVNVRNSFQVRKNEHVEGATVLLVDDVSESGATMKDAMRALYEAQVRNVIGVALAH